MRIYRNYKYNKANISNFIIEGNFDAVEPWAKRWAYPKWDYDSHNNNPFIECLFILKYQGCLRLINVVFAKKLDLKIVISTYFNNT